jgi:predicted amidophosphoribosyltransferase
MVPGCEGSYRVRLRIKMNDHAFEIICPSCKRALPVDALACPTCTKQVTPRGTAKGTAAIELPTAPPPKVASASAMSLKEYHRRVKTNHRHLVGLPEKDVVAQSDSATRTAVVMIGVVVVLFGLLLAASAALGWP